VINPSSEREMLAIAFLTGQATKAEAAEFARLSAEDADFRKLVREIESWLAPLQSDTAGMQPPAGLLDEILQSLPAPVPATAAVRTAAPPGSRVHWVWRPAALVATAAAVFATALPLVSGPIEASDSAAPVIAAVDRPGFVAALAGNGDAQVIVIVYDPDEERILARYSNVAPPEAGVWQLWLIRDGLPAPQSIGLISRETGADGEAELRFTEPLLPAGDLLAISLEPAGGSPEAGPTGPVLFTGKVSDLS
jgi:anti-sigma-K factor RskA